MKKSDLFIESKGTPTPKVFPKVTINLEEYDGGMGDEIVVSWNIQRGDETVETMSFKNDLYQDGEVFLPAIAACINGSLEDLLEELLK